MAETAYIRAARESWPGRILSVRRDHCLAVRQVATVGDDVARLGGRDFIRSEEYLSQREINQRLWADPQFRAKREAAHKAYRDDPNSRATLSAKAKALWTSPKYHADCSQRKQRISGAIPEFREINLSRLRTGQLDQSANFKQGVQQDALRWG